MRSVTKLVIGAIVASALTTPAFAQETIKFGVATAISGDAASFGKPFLDAIEVAVKRVNAQGGVLGKPIEVIAYDDRGVPDQGLQVSKKLALENKVVTLQPGSTSGVIFTAMPVGKDSRIAMWGYGLAEQWLVEGEGMIFRSAPPDKVMISAMANYAREELGLKRMGILNIDSFYGESARDMFKAAYEGGGGEIVTIASHADGARDISSQALSLAAKGLDGVFISTVGAGFAPIIRQARQFLPENVVIITETQMGDPQIRQELGDLTKGMYYYTSPLSKLNTDPVAQEWIKILETELGQFKEIMGRGVVGVTVMADAINRAGTTDGVEIMKQVHRTRDFPTPAGPFTYDPRDGEGVKTGLVVKAGATLAEDELAATSRVSDALYDTRVDYTRFFGPDYAKELYAFHGVE